MVAVGSQAEACWLATGAECAFRHFLAIGIDRHGLEHSRLIGQLDDGLVLSADIDILLGYNLVVELESDFRSLGIYLGFDILAFPSWPVP